LDYVTLRWQGLYSDCACEESALSSLNGKRKADFATSTCPRVNSVDPIE
jgi:hypothetical protein